MSTWEERAAEAGRLGRQVRTADADRRLLDLLLDSEDTAVSQAAADVLLEQNDARALRLYVIAFGQAEEDTRSKLGDCLYDDSGLRWDEVGLGLPSLVTDPEAEVRHGATVLGEHMREQAQHHTPPQFLPAAVWQGRSSGEAFADLLRERADNRNWRMTVEVQQGSSRGAMASQRSGATDPTKRSCTR